MIGTRRQMTGRMGPKLEWHIACCLGPGTSHFPFFFFIQLILFYFHFSLQKLGVGMTNDGQRWEDEWQGEKESYLGPRYDSFSPFLYLAKFLWILGAMTNDNGYETMNDTENGAQTWTTCSMSIGPRYVGSLWRQGWRGPKGRGSRPRCILIPWYVFLYCIFRY